MLIKGNANASRPSLDLYIVWSKINSYYSAIEGHREPISIPYGPIEDDTSFDLLVDQAIDNLASNNLSAVALCKQGLGSMIEANRSRCLSIIDAYVLESEALVKHRQLEIKGLIATLENCDDKLQWLGLGDSKIYIILNDLEGLLKDLDQAMPESAHRIKQKVNQHFDQVQRSVNQCLASS
jgi:hypothetical protein